MKEDIDAHYKAIAELAANMGWSIRDATYYWEGGEHNPERQKKLDQAFVDKGYRGDSDDLPGFAQFLYDEKILSVSSLDALDLTNYTPREYMLFWGEGYWDSEPHRAASDTRTRENLLSDDSLVSLHDRIAELQLGESLCDYDHGPMSIVRIK